MSGPRLALLSIAALLSAGCVAGTTREPFALPAACADAADIGALVTCAEPAIDRAAREGGARDLLAAMQASYARGELDDCHMLAHHLGHETIEHAAGLEAALRAGSADCFRGYYHGVVEAAIAARMRAGERSIRDLCDALADDEIAWDGCVHGIGHGLMWRSAGDVVGSLFACEELASAARIRCQAGVLMENSLQLITLPEIEYGERAPRACDGLPLPDEHRRSCGQQIGEVAMFRYRHDLSRAEALCARAEAEDIRAACRDGAIAEGKRA